MNRIARGSVGELAAETILEYETTVKKRWNSLPPYLRLDDEPFEVDAREAVRRSNCPRQLLLFAFSNSFTMVAHAGLVKPLSPIDHDERKEQLLSVLHQHIVSQSLRSCEALIYTLIQLPLRKFTVFCKLSVMRMSCIISQDHSKSCSVLSGVLQTVSLG